MNPADLATINSLIRYAILLQQVADLAKVLPPERK